MLPSSFSNLQTEHCEIACKVISSSKISESNETLALKSEQGDKHTVLSNGPLGSPELEVYIWVITELSEWGLVMEP